MLADLGHGDLVVMESILKIYLLGVIGKVANEDWNVVAGREGWYMSA